MDRLNGEQQERLLGVIYDLQALKNNEKRLKVSIKEKTDTVKMVLQEAGVEDKEVEVVGDWDLVLSLTGGGEKIDSKKVTPALVRTYFPKGMSAEAIKMTDPVLRLNIKEHKD